MSPPASSSAKTDSKPEPKSKPKKPRMTATRILDGAYSLADEIGVDRLTIRALADHLDTKPMTIYHHVPNKDAIIDGIVDRVFAEIERPPTDLGWKEAMRHRCCSARSALVAHPWAAPLMESRTNPGPETLSHHDAVIGCLRSGGLSLPMIGHVYALLDAFVYGFALQEAALPATDADGMAELAEQILQPAPDDPYPNLTEFAMGHAMQPGYDFRDEFEFGLDLVLDALEAAAEKA